MRIVRTACISTLLVLLVVPLRADDDWEALRHRPWSDDVFVMIDTSSAMDGPRGGSLASIKRFVQDLLGRYVKAGDRVCVMTFDSNARIRSTVSVDEPRRDGEMLREVIDGLDVRPVVRYDGVYPDLVESAGGRTVGGGAWSDYCEMWRLAARAMHAYSDPAHRRLFLLFTATPPNAPPYGQCNDPRATAAFASMLRDDRFRMAVVALPSQGRTADELAARLSDLLKGLAGDDATATSLRLFSFPEGDRHAGRLREEIRELIGECVELVQPTEVDLGAHYRIDLSTPVMLVNRSRARQRIAIRGATLRSPSTTRPLTLVSRPAEITLLPGQSGTLTVSGADLLSAPGDYRGELVFDFGSASRFYPGVLAFSAAKQTWMQAYGTRVGWAAAVPAVVVLLFAARARRVVRRFGA